MREDRPSSAGACHALLGPDDAEVVSVINPSGGSPFLLLGDHAGNRIPARLGTLGLSADDRARHIAWDIGVWALGEALSRRLDAAFVSQVYSRLVIDCNRDPASPEAVPEASDGTIIPGNAGLSAADRAARVAAFHAPYQEAIAATLEARAAAGRRTVLISLHSFTPGLQTGASPRPWTIGILHDGHDDRFARALLARLQARGDRVIGDNEPYRMDSTDHTVPRHAFAAGLAYAEIEIRQDLLAADVEGWADLLAAEFLAAL